MSDDREHTTSGAGTFIPEDPVRGALERGPGARPSDRPEAPAGGPTRLRSWSVAELIARAVPGPPAGGVAQ